MNDVNKIEQLYQKLLDETITEVEYIEFLNLVQYYSSSGQLDKMLDKELSKDLDGVDEKVLENKSRKNGKLLTLLSGIAASTAALAMSLFYIFNPGSENVTYATSNGETRPVHLPDGSRVILNANSELMWIESDRKNVRQVKLIGEAFFEVKPDKAKPFHVLSREMTVEVLGTSFNVNNRGGNNEVFLETGNVKINNQQDKKDTVKLHTGESAFFSSDQRKIIKSKEQRYADRALWKNGILRFTNVRTKEVLEEIGEIFGVTLVLDETELLERPLDLALPYSNWEIVGEGLALALGTRLVKRKEYYELIKQ